ncbi:MafI family immunity protein [Kribbella amoyensis]|uniref:MafI family immunity protein n=1 Tax=Kribbella amoyensis TaxID=996641 RepID=UPI00147882C0|nr:MafI family immunity protein [Kribbella amoyensis]
MDKVGWDDLLGRLRAVVLDVEASLAPERVQTIWELIDVGEPGIALELLCANLDDLEIEISSSTFTAIKAAGLTMQVDPSYWEVLQVAER